jgi:pyroglutamyl-peptidase
LITGFTPFRNHPVNPSKLLAEVLAKEGFDTLILPVSYASAEAALLNRIALTKYDFILSFGLAASRGRISLEEKAFNEKNSPVQNNDGKIVLSQKIRPNGAKELTNPLPLGEWQRRLQEKEVASDLSSDPGRYVCNEIYYLDLSSGIPCLFVHLPNLDKSSLAADVALAKELLALAKKLEFQP